MSRTFYTSSPHLGPNPISCHYIPPKTSTSTTSTSGNYDPYFIDVDSTGRIPNIEKCVPGLKYIPNYLSEKDVSELLGAIQKVNPDSWIVKPNSQRRSLHYGAKYLYDADKVTTNRVPPITEVPELHQVSKRINWEFFNAKMDEGGDGRVAQINVHHYTPTQGIAPHVDNEVFGPTVVILSLGSPRVMRFRLNNLAYDIVLKPRSALILNDAARYTWQHSIPVHRYSGKGQQKEDRYSITFRSLSIGIKDTKTTMVDN